MQVLPIGLSDFSFIRCNNLLYIDKTEKIKNLLSDGFRYFLSRPRRFGKSMTVSTIEAIFQGKEELFNGLAAEELAREYVKI